MEAVARAVTALSFSTVDSISFLRAVPGFFIVVWLGLASPVEPLVWMLEGGCMVLRRRLLTNLLLGVAVVVASIGSQPAAASNGSNGQTRQIAAGGTASLPLDSPESPAGIESFETPSLGGDGANVNRSNSSPGDSMPVGAISQPKNVTLSAPGLLTSFNGINHNNQRFGSPNQFSLEPPDQGLCVGSDGAGHTRVLEVVNDTLRVYDTTGAPVTGVKALNAFYNYPPAIIRNLDPSKIIFGPFVTDPSCIYDAPTGRWFLVVLTLDTFPHVGTDGLQHFPGTNHLDLAVSKTADPTGTWTIYRIPVQDDGTAGTPPHGCSPSPKVIPPPVPTNPTACFGDFPHIGSNGAGIYLTTNEYSFFGPEFHGAQVYALSKAQLAISAASVSVTQFDTHGLDTFGFARNGFTLWPSVTPTVTPTAGYGGGDATNGGTEYFLSTNGGAEAHDMGDGKSTFHNSTQLLVWSLTNTNTLDTAPALTLSSSKLEVGQYTLPPSSVQKSGNQPLRTCLNSSACSQFLEGIKDPFAEKSANLDSSDTREMQVTWVNGALWGAIDTGLNISSAKQAGIEWFKVAASGGAGGASLSNSGYLGLGNDNLTYPAIGITTGGTGVLAFTVVGASFFPSAGYATIDGNGVSDIHIAAVGLGPDDGFTNYRLFADPPNFTPRPRWGDYGAAVPMGSNVWLASEYIAQSCDFSTWLNTNFRCGGTRTALGNWGTRISLVSAP